MRTLSLIAVAGAVLGLAVCLKPVLASPGATMADLAQPMTLSDFLPVQDGGPPGLGKHRKEDGPGSSGPGGFEDRAERREKMMERIDRLPPEEREQALQEIEEMKARREALKEELKDLPPEEREARMEQLKAEWEEKRAAKREEFREKFQERWDTASETERAEFCDNARQRCAEGGNHACEFANKSCGGAQ